MLPLNEYRDGAEIAVTIAAAVASGLMDALTDAPVTADEAAERAHLDPRATAIVLDALADVGLVERDGPHYAPTREGRRRFVDRTSPEYAAKGLPLWLNNLARWVRLPEALRDGGLPANEESERGDQALGAFLAGMAAAPAERTARMVRMCMERRPEARAVLDLGGGPGHIARAFIEQAQVNVTMVERPEVVDYGRRHLELDRVDGLTLVAGDFMAEPLPEGPFDIVLISNITHMYGPEDNRRLLEKAHAVLAPGGLVAVADFVRGRSYRAARFAIVMLLGTEAGNTYDEATYQMWLKGAGFTDMRIADVDTDRQILTARRPATEG